MSVAVITGDLGFIPCSGANDAGAAATPVNSIVPDLKTDNLNVKMKSDAFDKIPEYDLRNTYDPCEEETKWQKNLKDLVEIHHSHLTPYSKQILFHLLITLEVQKMVMVKSALVK